MPESHYLPRPPSIAPQMVLGTMNFGRRTSREESLRILSAAVEQGITLLDTANVYNDGRSEEIVGSFARNRPEVEVATKVGLARVGGRAEGLTGVRVQAACEESLRRLQLERIDLYYLHAPDHSTPLEDTLSGIQGLLDSGKILRWGVSNFASWQILELRNLALERGLPPPAVAQQLYNLLIRQLDIEYFRYARRYPIHTTVYNPLAGGLLTGARSFDTSPPKGSRFDNNPMYRRRYWQRALFAAVEDLRQIAVTHGMELWELAYAFVGSHPGVDSVLIGPGSLEHLEAALRARGKVLGEDVQRQVTMVYTQLVGTDAQYAR